MKGRPQDVKWAPEGASASHNFPAKTANVAPMVTFTTRSASVSYAGIYFWCLILVCLWAHAAMGKEE